MTASSDNPKPGKMWLRSLALVSGFTRLNNSPYRKSAIFAALLLGVPLLFRLVGVPFAFTFVLMAFVCIMRFLLIDAWPRNPETGIRRRWGLVPFAYVIGFMLFIGIWATQPHFGANVCPLKGFTWTTDFVEEIRPMIHRNIRERSVLQGDWLPDGVTVAQFTAVVDQAVDLLKQCVAERGVDYCRYAGPDPSQPVIQGRTNEGPNAIEPRDEYKYRYIKTGLDFDVSMVPYDTGGNSLRLRIWRFGTRVEAGGKICDLGCWCNADRLR